jgi:hypothetical protein
MFDTSQSYADRGTAQWDFAELNIVEAVSTSQFGQVAIVQAEAIVDWLDPRPAPDNTPGPRAHVAVRDECPACDTRLAGVRNSEAPLTTRLLPPGRPTKGLLCIYSWTTRGVTSPLVRKLHLGMAPACRLAASAGALSLSHGDRLISSCGIGSTTAVLPLS